MALVAALKSPRHAPGDFEEYAGNLASLTGEQVIGSSFLFCNGAAVSRLTYAALYKALGGAASPWGQGDGSTTFNLPDYRDKMILHRGPIKAVVGATAGAWAHSHSFSHVHTIRAHTHGMGNHIHDQSHTHSYNSNFADYGADVARSGGTGFSGTGHNHSGTTGGATASATSGASTNTSGGVGDQTSGGSSSTGSTTADSPHIVSGAVVVRF